MEAVIPQNIERIIERIEPSETDIRFTRKDGDRYEFTFDGFVNIHLLPDEYECVGFGTGWFAIRSDK